MSKALTVYKPDTANMIGAGIGAVVGHYGIGFIFNTFGLYGTPETTNFTSGITVRHLAWVVGALAGYAVASHVSK